MLPTRCIKTAGMLAGLLLAASGAQAEVLPTETPELKNLDEIVSRGISQKHFPGAVLVVGRPGKILWAKAYGHATYDADAPPMTLNTIFDLASISKVAGTATAAMLLVEEGRLKLDDRVSSHLPLFASGGKEEVTVRDLMTHVSGLKPYESFANAEKERSPEESTADAMIRRIAQLPASYPPRSKVAYSCLNMQTQARVNETVLEGRMDDYLREKVWEPLGMSNTTYRLNEEQKARTVPTAAGKSGEGNAAKIHDPLAGYHSSEEHCPGNAGLFSTAPDLARYCEMILEGGKAGDRQIMKPETVELMTSLHTPEGIDNKRALGWDIYTKEPYCTPLNQTDKTRVIGHTGYTGTLIWLDKLSKTYVVFLTNRTWPDDSKESSRGISEARKAVCETVIKSRPQYRALTAK